MAGDRASLEVEGLTPSGEGLAGRIRVAGAFPGERVEARIDHVGKHATFATLLGIERAHPGRRAPPCPRHAGPRHASISERRERGPARGPARGNCTGCPLMELEEGAQREMLRAMLRAQHGLEVEEVIAAPEALGYRRSAKRIAFGGPGRLRLGSFVRGTHRPADMAGCRVDHPRIAAAADELAEVARAIGLAAHGPSPDRPGLRSVWLRTDGEVVLTTLVTSDPELGPLHELGARLERTHGLFVSRHEGEGNSLRGDPPRRIFGIEAIEVQGARIGPLGFLQPNPRVAARIYEDLLAGIERGPVWDLYAGSGATTQRLRARGLEVLPCEAHPESAAALGVEARSVEAFLERALAGESPAPAAIVANPPRKGLGPEVVASLARARAPLLRLMSCGPAGLAEDLRGLAPTYRLTRLRAYDTLPQTAHVELLAELVLRDDSGEEGAGGVGPGRAPR